MAETPIIIDNLPTVTINSLNPASSIDPVNDYVPIYTNSATATQGINRNIYLGLSSAPVGLTDSQTLTNKTLTNPNINSAILSGTVSGTYTIGGTPTFPSSVVLLTGTQTITGTKTFTAATLTAPTITNASISTDALTGFTSTTSGALYGISVVSGVVTTANSIGSGANVTNGVQAAALATNAITLGYAQITASFSTTVASSDVAVTGLSVTVTVPAGGRYVRITAWCGSFYKTGSTGDILYWQIKEGSTVLSYQQANIVGSNYAMLAHSVYIKSGVSAGSHTYTVFVNQSTAGTVTVQTSTTQPAFILAEAI